MYFAYCKIKESGQQFITLNFEFFLAFDAFIFLCQSVTVLVFTVCVRSMKLCSFLIFLKYVYGNTVESSLTASMYDSIEQILFFFYFDIPLWFSDSVLDIYELHANLGSMLFVKHVTEKKVDC